MRTVLCVVISVFLIGSTASSVYADLQADIDKATTIVEEFKAIPEDTIPPSVLENCKGLAIISIGKAGFILSGRGGSGIVIAKTPAGWSAPSSIGVGGGGFGFQIGAQITDFVLVLNTDSAVEAFSKGSNVSLGGDLSISAGPVGRTAEAGVTPVAAIYSYSRSKGLFAGVSLEGTVLVEGKETNKQFYGREIPSQEILSGSVPPPASAGTLYQALAGYIPAVAPVTTTVVQ